METALLLLAFAYFDVNPIFSRKSAVHDVSSNVNNYDGNDKLRVYPRETVEKSIRPNQNVGRKEVRRARYR